MEIHPRSAAPRRQLVASQPNGQFTRSSGMPSTVIRRFDYSPDNAELTIEFVTGRRYVYSGVPEEEAEAMRSAFSKGTYFNKQIRDRYPYRELV